MGRKLFTGIFTFHGRGAAKRFVTTTSVNQSLTNNKKFHAANRFGKNHWIIIKSVYFDILEKQKCLCEGDPELSMTRNCRVHCSLALDIRSFSKGMRKELNYILNKYDNKQQLI